MISITVCRKVKSDNEQKLIEMVKTAEEFVLSKYPEVSFDAVEYWFHWNANKKYRLCGFIEHRIDKLSDMDTIQKEIVQVLVRYAEDRMDATRKLVSEFCGDEVDWEPVDWHSDCY